MPLDVIWRTDTLPPLGRGSVQEGGLRAPLFLACAVVLDVTDVARNGYSELDATRQALGQA